MQNLDYIATEKIRTQRPVDRIDYFALAATGKKILDLGAYDETAIDKKDKNFWLHGRMANVATQVIGIDNSPKLPDGELATSSKSKIIKGDIFKLHEIVDLANIDIITAGELIEHLPATLDFLVYLKSLEALSGKIFVLSTPNAACLSNFFLGLFKRENNDVNHLQVYSFKTLNTLFLRAKFEDWEFQPYYEKFPEMIFRTKGSVKFATLAFQKIVNTGEYLFPMLCGGWIVKIVI